MSMEGLWFVQCRTVRSKLAFTCKPGGPLAAYIFSPSLETGPATDRPVAFMSSCPAQAAAAMVVPIICHSGRWAWCNVYRVQIYVEPYDEICNKVDEVSRPGTELSSKPWEVHMSIGARWIWTDLPDNGAFGFEPPGGRP